VQVSAATSSPWAICLTPITNPNKDKLKALKIDWKADDDVGAIRAERGVGTGRQVQPALAAAVHLRQEELPPIRPEVKAFVDSIWPMPLSCRRSCSTYRCGGGLQDGRGRFNKLQVGTGFGGKSEFGLPLEEILKREPKL
jgi:hypothetical protein